MPVVTMATDLQQEIKANTSQSTGRLASLLKPCNQMMSKMIPNDKNTQETSKKQ